jgi:hypothetical protein
MYMNLQHHWIDFVGFSAYFSTSSAVFKKPGPKFLTCRWLAHGGLAEFFKFIILLSLHEDTAPVTFGIQNAHLRKMPRALVKIQDAKYSTGTCIMLDQIRCL